VSDRAAVLVVPLAPAPDGNGLAMRAGMLLEVMATAGPVDVVIVPVSGPATPHAWAAARARRVVVVDPSRPRSRAAVVELLGDACRRAMLEEMADLPARARAADPGLASAVADAWSNGVPTGDGAAPPVVVVLRAYLAPFGCTLARQLGAARVVVDVDDDDERWLRDRGEHAEADAYARLTEAWLGDVDLVVAASSSEAEALAHRHPLRAVAAIPNAIRRPRAVSPPPRHDRVLFVGNLTYAPNVEAARVLALDVLPALRAEIPGATVDLVGPCDERVADLATDGVVRVTDRVPDVAPHYAAADVVVVPLSEGAGTRIKVLEAFAFERAVVATPIAVHGLAVLDGESVLLGEDAVALAAHAAALLRDPGATRRLVVEASRVLGAHYLLDVVAPRARRVLFSGGG